MTPAEGTARRIGAHLPLGGGMVKAAERAVEIGATTLQIFSDNPTAWRRRASLPAELDAFLARLREADIAPLTIHASYLINLAGPEDAFYERSIELLASELTTGQRYGAAFVNVHIGSHRGAGIEAGVARLGQGIARVFERADGGGGPTLVLENSAGGGGGIGATVDELARILDAADAYGAPLERIAFCFDTAHLWAAGHDLRDRAQLNGLLSEFDRTLGMRRLVLVHLNDAKTPRGSHLDRHEHVGGGLIGARGMGNVVRHPALAHVAFVLETPGMDEGYDAVNLERVRLLLARRRLPPLPPGAKLVAGSRSRRTMPELPPDEA